MSTNPDVLLGQRFRQIRNRVKEIQDAWDRRYSEDEEEYNEEDDY